ncbi:MAG: hypothetical protein ACQKBU_08005, partial [Verrucomicrobiales bacterium]
MKLRFFLPIFVLASLPLAAQEAPTATENPPPASQSEALDFSLEPEILQIKVTPFTADELAQEAERW